MNLDLSDEALEYGRVARRAIEKAGGDLLVQEAERDPVSRQSLVAPLLGELGAAELDVRDSSDQLEAAAALCRSFGYWGVAYPVAEVLCRPRDLDVDGLVVVSDEGAPAARPKAAVAGLPLRLAAVTPDGLRSIARPRPLAVAPRKSGFVTELDLDPVDSKGSLDPALGLVLPCWTLLGMLDRAMELTCSYVQQRQQFGQPLAAFQGVQFQLTDAEVERAGLEELAKYTLWSVEAAREDALHDALALRLAAIEAADTVFRITHQLHGAIGFCDETTLSWLSRYSIPLRRLPLGLSATRYELTRRIGPRGLSGLFGPRSPGDRSIGANS
ncbi:MAG TPA: acyl-CoA dehydrogenase family protein [Acidimicrobiales bacterium]|nr:acyl-CoA dehydrogenase family protein [Acidimicrobiales bacterium]